MIPKWLPPWWNVLGPTVVHSENKSGPKDWGCMIDIILVDFISVWCQLILVND